MRLSVLAVGHRQPAWVSDGCAEYLKRMPRELPAGVTEIKPEPRGSKTREQLLAAEKGRIRDALPAQVVLMTPNPAIAPMYEPDRNRTLKPYVEAVRRLAQHGPNELEAARRFAKTRCRPSA